MKKLILTVVALSSIQAFAATGFLLNCVNGSGPGGGAALIGTYDVSGTKVVMYFPITAGYCPTQVQVP
jgi:hypothetical protein